MPKCFAVKFANVVSLGELTLIYEPRIDTQIPQKECRTIDYMRSEGISHVRYSESHSEGALAEAERGDIDQYKP